MELFTGALQNGLDQAADGADVSWSNPKTGAGGTLTFLDTRAPAETICRRVQIANKAKGQQSKVINTFCKNAAEEWKVHR
jgi:surface antigen